MTSTCTLFSPCKCLDLLQFSAARKLVSQMHALRRVTASVALAAARGKRVDDVAKDILEYFLRHPDSADSLTGIARCRVLEQAVHRSVKTTEDALEWLIARGYLETIPLRGSEPVFQLNREKRTEAEKFLKLRANRSRRHEDSG